MGVASEAESQSDVVYWFMLWAGNQKVVGSTPGMIDCPWLLISSGTGPVISRVIKSFWIKVSAKWLLSHSRKPLGCLILQQCVSAVTVFLAKRWAVCADASLKALLLSSFAHSLFPVCHRLPSCHLYFSVSLWASEESQFPFSRWLFAGQATAGPAPQTRGVAHASPELFYRSHSGIRVTCLQRCLCLLHLICAHLIVALVKTWANQIEQTTDAPILHFLADIIAFRMILNDTIW